MLSDGPTISLLPSGLDGAVSRISRTVGRPPERTGRRCRTVGRPTARGRGSPRLPPTRPPSLRSAAHGSRDDAVVAHHSRVRVLEVVTVIEVGAAVAREPDQ